MPPPNTKRSEPLTPQETVEQYQKELRKRINNTSRGSRQRRRWNQLYKVATRPDATTTSIWDAVSKQRENRPEQLPKPKPKPQVQQKELPGQNADQRGMRTFVFSASAARVQPDFVYYAPQNTDHRSSRSKNWSSQPTASTAHAPHSTTVSSSTREARLQSTNKPGTVVPATSSRSTRTPEDPPQGVNSRPIVDNSKGSGHSPSHRNTKKQKQKKTTPAPSQLSSTGPSMVQNDENPVRASASAPLPVQSAHSQKSKAHNVKSTSRPSTPEPHSPTKKTIPGSPKPTGSTKSSPSRRAKSSDVDMFGGDITDWDTQMEKFDFEEYAKSFNDFVESYNSYQNEMFGWQTEGGG